MFAAHRSIAIARRARTAIGAFVAVLIGAFSGSCTTVKAKARVVSRAGPYRGVAVVPQSVSALVVIDAGKDALTDDELADLERRLPSAILGIAQELAVAATTDPIGLSGIVRHGELVLLRVKVRAAAGRERHKTSVDCRVRVRATPERGGDVLVEVEGSALQLVVARNLSMVELPELEAEIARTGGRNPLLEVADTEAAIVAACRAAVAAVIDDSRPDDESIDDVQGRGAARSARTKERLERLRRARERLAKANAQAPRAHDAYAAAIVDVGATGGLADVALVRTAYHDDHPLVRRAARAAFVDLCGGHQLLPAAEGAVATCTPPAEPPPVAPVAPEAPSAGPERVIVDDDGDDDDDADVDAGAGADGGADDEVRPVVDGDEPIEVLPKEGHAPPLSMSPLPDPPEPEPDDDGGAVGPQIGTP